MEASNPITPPLVGRERPPEGPATHGSTPTFSGSTSTLSPWSPISTCSPPSERGPSPSSQEKSPIQLARQLKIDTKATGAPSVRVVKPQTRPGSPVSPPDSPLQPDSPKIRGASIQRSRSSSFDKVGNSGNVGIKLATLPQAKYGGCEERLQAAQTTGKKKEAEVRTSTSCRGVGELFCDSEEGYDARPPRGGVEFIGGEDVRSSGDGDEFRVVAKETAQEIQRLCGLNYSEKRNDGDEGFVLRIMQALKYFDGRGEKK